MKKQTMDANSATAYISYALSEIAVIYPITPSSPMAEAVDEWASKQKKNLFGETPKITQMQSESGVAGAVHGALTCGGLTTTYTCSQGLLLMIPNMYKIAGELLPTVFHVSARALSTHALNIFGDHQDVMACRQTGFAMLCSSSVQEAMDFSLISHLSTLKTSVPFMHFFDGFRTSHEFNKIDVIEYEELNKLVDVKDIASFKNRSLSPKNPIQRGTAQNGDIYFQNRERANPFYFNTPRIVENIMDKVTKITGRAYHLFDYFGNKNAENVVVMMGSGCSAMQKTIEYENEQGESFGIIKVRLYRPFSAVHFLNALPNSCKNIAVLDRTKECGALGEPLYLDVCAALLENKKNDIRVIGGRYGLGGKDFTPSCAYAVLQNLKQENPKNHFTVGINDDVSYTSLTINSEYHIAEEDCISCLFYGLGSDGTVGSNKNAVSIIGDKTNLYAQAYFEYDSKKSGGATISHLRFGKEPISSSYLIEQADFLSCHNPSYLERYDFLKKIKQGGIFLLNTPHTTLDQLERFLPNATKRCIAEKQLRFYVLDGTKIAKENGLSGRTGMIMQAAFFALHPHILPYEQAIAYLKEDLAKKFSKKSQDVVQKNYNAIDQTLASLKEINYPETWTEATEKTHFNSNNNEYFQQFIQPILRLQGNQLPVSKFSPDGSVPTATAKYEDRGISALLPEWIAEHCIQCNQCAYVCPHATIRPYLIDENQELPDGMITLPAFGAKDKRFKIQVCYEHCMGCGICANVCPAPKKALIMQPPEKIPASQIKLWDFFQKLPVQSLPAFKRNTVKGSQFYPPLFEFSYACAGCGETPYIKVLTQLFGEKLLIANATGCSSIYGGSAPSCPYAVNQQGQGPAWASSLFEDNAEFGYGMRLALDVKENNQEKSVWIIGGDGWAYDIGYGGLDHVLALNPNVNVLILDSEVYSNTGGQASKATPKAAVARFAAGGKKHKKKDLGLMAMTYGNVYVAQVAMGANMQQYLTALSEAESYDGASLIIAYSPCIAHGENMSKSMQAEKLAVDSGYFPLYRFDPRKKAEGKNPLCIDSKKTSVDITEFLNTQGRFTSLYKVLEQEQAEELFAELKKESQERLAFLEKLSQL